MLRPVPWPWLRYRLTMPSLAVRVVCIGREGIRDRGSSSHSSLQVAAFWHGVVRPEQTCMLCTQHILVVCVVQLLRWLSICITGCRDLKLMAQQSLLLDASGKCMKACTETVKTVNAALELQHRRAHPKRPCTCEALRASA